MHQLWPRSDRRDHLAGTELIVSVCQRDGPRVAGLAGCLEARQQVRKELLRILRKKDHERAEEAGREAPVPQHVKQGTMEQDAANRFTAQIDP
eukprot:3579964-Lingulodinium_polyedra.AAC.1